MKMKFRRPSFNIILEEFLPTYSYKNCLGKILVKIIIYTS